MSYVVKSSFTAVVDSEEKLIEVESDILSTKKEADELAVTLIKKMGFICRVEGYDSEPAEPPYGAYKGEE